jgi:hypothetical protein
MVQLKLMRLSMFLPIAVLDLSGASSCVPSCRVTLDTDGNLTITTPACRITATKTGFVRGAAVFPVPVLVAILLPCVGELSSWYRLCTWAGDVPESVKTTAAHAGLLHARSTCPCVLLLPRLAASP